MLRVRGDQTALRTVKLHVRRALEQSRNGTRRCLSAHYRVQFLQEETEKLVRVLLNGGIDGFVVGTTKGTNKHRRIPLLAPFHAPNSFLKGTEQFRVTQRECGTEMHHHERQRERQDVKAKLQHTVQIARRSQIGHSDGRTLIVQPL